MTRIVFVLTPTGRDCHIMIDGIDISHAVRAVELSSSVDDGTEVWVQLIGSVEVIAEVTRAIVTPPDES